MSATKTVLELAALFNTCAVTKPGDTDRLVTRILAGRTTYEKIARAVNVPWYMIAVIHYRESTLSFRTHLHNGDPLTARTVHVPAGRPKTGEPPFTFIDSAIDALTVEGYKDTGDPTIGDLLWLLEKYNGTGYRERGVPSPYLWSWTDKYSAGKYIADNVYAPDAVDGQCGVAALLLRLYLCGHIMLRGEPVRVTLGGKSANIAAFVLRGNAFVAVRSVVAALGGTMTIPELRSAVSPKVAAPAPFAVSVTNKAGTGRVFALRQSGGIGYVDASDLLAFFGRNVAWDGKAGVLSIG